MGYYAFARALLIQRNLDFRPDYEHANKNMREERLDANGNPLPVFVTKTGHLENHFTVGPALLWSPFLLTAHFGVALARLFGSTVPNDGFSLPYRLAMALGTCIYGFAGLLLAFEIARRYVEERFALLGTIGIWGATSLPVYMYFNPSWSHAHSAFVVSLFVWYWHRTLPARNTSQWLILGVIAGLMLNVYYANATLLLIPATEAILEYGRQFKAKVSPAELLSKFVRHLMFVTVTVICLAPTFITKLAIYGGATQSGYIPMSKWNWFAPHFAQVILSSNHGLIAWTPVVLLAFLGLIAFAWENRAIGMPLLVATLGFYYFIASYPDWAGISSYGNRFFVSLTPIFLIGLSVFFSKVASVFSRPSLGFRWSIASVALLIVWNAGLMFQWGAHLIPVRGAVSWSLVAHNQFAVVPRQISGQLGSYMFRRRDLMRDIEKRDQEQLRQTAE